MGCGRNRPFDGPFVPAWSSVEDGFEGPRSASIAWVCVCRVWRRHQFHDVKATPSNGFKREKRHKLVLPGRGERGGALQISTCAFRGSSLDSTSGKPWRAPRCTSMVASLHAHSFPRQPPRPAFPYPEPPLVHFLAEAGPLSSPAHWFTNIIQFHLLHKVII